jgi:hypothetical protein
MQTSSLDKGAQMLRSEMARARVMAIKTGKVHALLLTPGGSEMTIRDFESMAAEGSGSLSIRNSSVSTRTNWGEGLLPPGIMFVSGETAETNRSRFITSGTAADSGNNRPILFYPDGTCQDAQVTLQNQKGHRKQVTLRGLTGTSRVSNPG